MPIKKKYICDKCNCHVKKYFNVSFKGRIDRYCASCFGCLLNRGKIIKEIKLSDYLHIDEMYDKLTDIDNHLNNIDDQW